MLPICFVVFMVLRQGTTQDVCNQYEPLPNAALRYYNYRVDRVIVHDFNLIPGWYRAGDEIILTEKPTSLDICGTRFPVWMNGTHPTVAEGIVDRVACSAGVESFCDISYDIRVRNCTTYSVYFLTSTGTSNEAYCFGKGQEGEVPNFVPVKPVVYPTEVIKQGGTTNYSHVHFVCNFEPSQDVSDAGLHYQVFWYAAKNKIEKVYVMPEQPKDKLSDLQLTEDIFRNKMRQTLGVNISCAVLALSGPKGIPGKQSDRSDAFFAGIRVNVLKSRIVRGDDNEQGRVTLTSTIPIGCPGTRGCGLPIRANVPEGYKCKGPSFGKNCGTDIKSDQWNNPHDIVIKAADSAEYSLHGIFSVYLNTAKFFTGARIWDNYSLPNFQVEIVDSPKKYWTGKVCSSNNDPHMTTFDGRPFENHIVGEYILYRHLFFKAEVQIKIRSCDGRSQILCNCGVAVKAGLDVFVVDQCENFPFVGYKDGHCVDSALDVRKSGNTYRINLLYGTYITFTLEPGNKFLNVRITPSIHDQSANSTGLCGALTGDDCTDDFRMRDGSWPAHGVNLNCKSNWMIQPDSIINEWRVRPNENLFILSKEVKDNLSPWVTYVCVCGENSVVDAPIPCGGHTTQQCHSGSIVGTRACKIINTRRRRSVPAKDRFPTPKDRIRRSTRNQLEENVTMTEEEALTYCQIYMNQSQIFKLCQNVPSTRSEKDVETCAADIILTNTTVWSNSARESMREQCLNEISRNNTFREVEEDSGIVAEIQEKACPSMCSYRGRCIHGICMCDPGYGASDCSTSLHEPPEIFGLLDNGLCDERHVECDHAFVYGEIFAEGENLTCRIKPFTLSYKGDRNYKETVYVPAEHETLFEVVCPVQKTRRKKRSLATNIQAQDRFVIGYTISVSNDGQNYGKDSDLYMYNSECQLAENTSTTFSFVLQDGYCFINHICVVSGTIYEKDECLICDDKQSEFEWSTRHNHTACRNVPETTPSPVTTFIPKGSSPKLKINFILLFASTIAFGIIFPSY